MQYNVAIIGGGPSGSTTAALLKKYNPALKVLVLEREIFPRDHVGESQLPPIVRILVEMGVWSKVEAAGFPIKIGGTYRWGKGPELWDIEFIPSERFRDEPRPAKFHPQRYSTPYQVDRSIYDKILLDHAESLGAEVRQGAKVVQVQREGDRVTGLKLASGEVVTAEHYIDASGTSGILRRAMGVGGEYPTTLQNIAIWDYWQNAEWAVQIGVGGTRIQVRSLGYGWLWFIPLSRTRTSIGLVIPVQHFKQCKRTPKEVYDAALQEETTIAGLLAKASCENKLKTTKDWSNLACRMTGENWFLVGESAGFADPILSAGLTIAHQSAREAAYTILEIERGSQDGEWLKEQFGSIQAQRIRTHIRFADYWYTANSQFKELKEFTQELARDAGLDLDPESAWQWIGQGGFINEDATLGSGGFTIGQVKRLGTFLSDLPPHSPLERMNVFDLDLDGAQERAWAAYADGRISKHGGLVRGGRVLLLTGPLKVVVEILKKWRKAPDVARGIAADLERHAEPERPHIVLRRLEALEALIYDGWVKASYEAGIPFLPKAAQRMATERWNTDTRGSSTGEVA